MVVQAEPMIRQEWWVFENSKWSPSGVRLKQNGIRGVLTLSLSKEKEQFKTKPN